jgi:RNA polymerase sigma-70 factor (ECF subfamily)
MLLSVLRDLGTDARPSGPRAVRAIGTLEIPDETLVERALAGERLAAADLYRRHMAYLLGMVVRMLRSRTEGEDVVQETFAVALDRLGTLRDPAAFRSWAAQIAVSLVRRRLRRQRLRQALGLAKASEDATLECLASETCSGEVRAELALVDVVIVRLPAEQRLAWMLRYVEGEELEAVARLSGCSLATAKRRIAAAAARVNAHVAIRQEAP